MINYNRITINIASLIISAIIFFVIVLGIKEYANNSKISNNYDIKQNIVDEIGKKN